MLLEELPWKGGGVGGIVRFVYGQDIVGAPPDFWVFEHDEGKYNIEHSDSQYCWTGLDAIAAQAVLHHIFSGEKTND